VRYLLLLLPYTHKDDLQLLPVFWSKGHSVFAGAVIIQPFKLFRVTGIGRKWTSSFTESCTIRSRGSDLEIMDTKYWMPLAEPSVVICLLENVVTSMWICDVLPCWKRMFVCCQLAGALRTTPTWHDNHINCFLPHQRNVCTLYYILEHRNLFLGCPIHIQPWHEHFHCHNHSCYANWPSHKDILLPCCWDSFLMGCFIFCNMIIMFM